MAVLTMEDSACGYPAREKRLVMRFPCNSAGFSACSIPPLKAPESPRKPSDLSPEPSPKDVSTRSRRWQRRSVARESARAAVMSSGPYGIRGSEASAVRGWRIAR
jgi:hypothetical protein